MAQHSLTDAQMDKVHSIVVSGQRAKEKERENKMERKEEAKLVGEALGAAALVSFVRGKMEATDGSWNIPGTQIDIEGVAGLGLLGAALSRKVFGKHSQDALNASVGILGHYVGQLTRKFAKTGNFTLIAGS